MSSNKLVVTVLMAVAVFNLSACKKDGDSTRTTMRHANKNGTNTQGKPGDPANPNATPAGAAPAAEGGKGMVIGGSETCQSIQAKAKSLGWKTDVVEVAESSASQNKIQIAFYTLEKSTMKNPVIYFEQTAFQHVEEADLNRFSKYSTSYGIDPVLMDMRNAGCSAPAANQNAKTQVGPIYGSAFAVADAEAIRKKLLTGEVKKWKVMANRTGGVVALRYVQMFPDSVESIHIADFIPMKDQTTLEKSKMVQEKDNWEQLAKSQNVSENELHTAQKNLEKEKCEPDFKNCADLLDLYAGTQLSFKNQWESIAKDIKAIAAGTKKAADLKKVFDNRKAYVNQINSAKFIDVDSDKSLSACANALKAEKPGVLSSCRLQVALARSESANFRANMNHNALDIAKIKENLKKNNIEYILFAGGRSSLYPSDLYQEHVSEMDELLTAGYHLDKEAGSEIVENQEFLESLKSK